MISWSSIILRRMQEENYKRNMKRRKERQKKISSRQMCIYNSASSTHQVIHGGFCARDPQPPAAPRPVNMHSLLPHLSSALPAIICPIHLSSESFQRKTYELRSVPEVVSRHPFPARLPLRTSVTWEKMAADTFRRVDSVNKRCLQPVPFFLRPCYNVGKLRLRFKSHAVTRKLDTGGPCGY